MKDPEQDAIAAVRLEIIHILQNIAPPLMLPERTLRAQVALAMPRRPKEETVTEAITSLVAEGTLTDVYNRHTGQKYRLSDEGRGDAAEL